MTNAPDVLAAALEKGAAGERLERDQALSLVASIDPANLHQLGAAALSNRRRRFGDTATYVFNLQVNPTNICGMHCTFCNYAASPRDPHAYVMDEEEIFDQVARLSPAEVHIVGGLNRIWPYRRNLELVRELHRRWPRVHIKCFTAVEIDFFAKSEQTDAARILAEFKDAGMQAMPGGGAEIFSERLWQQHWKNKIGPADWLRIHRLAHEMGISTNATMLFGFGDTWQERIEHLLTLRAAQDRSKGFACFIPLPFQPGKGKFMRHGPTPLEVLTVLAVSRLVLDNIGHLKSYWPMTGLATAAAGLSWGADDMDGTISEEKIAHLAGAPTPLGLARERMVDTIRTAGFTPCERDGQFNPCGPPAGTEAARDGIHGRAAQGHAAP